MEPRPEDITRSVLKTFELESRIEMLEELLSGIERLSSGHYIVKGNDGFETHVCISEGRFIHVPIPEVKVNDRPES